MFASKIFKPVNVIRIAQGMKPQTYLNSSLINPTLRAFFTISSMSSRQNSIYQAQYQYNLLNPFSYANFSVKMDKVRAKMARKKGTK